MRLSSADRPLRPESRRATQTALIVPVPEAEPAVGRFRASLDRVASWGVPAHVTVLYPFLPPERIDEPVLAALRDVVAAVPRFDTLLSHVDWFGDAVVWLAPLAGPAVPGPHRGGVAPVPRGAAVRGRARVPHLTIGHDTGRPVLEHAATEVSAHLPIAATVHTVRLIAGTPEHSPWLTVDEFPLGA